MTAARTRKPKQDSRFHREHPLWKPVHVPCHQAFNGGQFIGRHDLCQPRHPDDAPITADDQPGGIGARLTGGKQFTPSFDGGILRESCQIQPPKAVSKSALFCSLTSF
jgi:hypothetical protein